MGIKINKQKHIQKLVLDTIHAYEEFDWEVANTNGSMQTFVSSARYQPWGKKEKRIDTAIEAAKWFKWDDAVIVLRTFRKLITEENEIEEAYPAFLKTTPVPTSATLFGKLGLKKMEYQWAFFNKRITTWLMTEKQWFSLDERNIVDEVMRYAKKVLYKGKGVIIKPISFRLFLSNRMWEKSGATSWKDWVPRGFSSTKTTIALTMSTEEMVSELEKRWLIWQDPEKYEKAKMERGMSFTIHAKPEPMKTRAVIADVMDLYLYFSFITEYVYPFLQDNPHLIQAMSSDRKFAFWRECQMFIGKLNVTDLDYSVWDEGVLKEVVLKLVDMICQLGVSISSQHPDVVEVSKRIKTILSVIGIIIISEDGPMFIEWKNGLITGFLWTWLLNGLVNCAMQMYLLSVIGISPEILVVQGDDIHMVSSMSEEQYNEYLDLNDAVGFTINKTKSSYTPKLVGGGEFLQMEIKWDRISGNPHRMIRSLIWGSLEVVEGSQLLEVDLATKMNERVSIWAQAISRELYYEKSFVVDDLFGVARRSIRKGTIMKMLHSSKAVGGFALFGLETETKFEWVKEKVETKPVKVWIKQINFTKSKQAWDRGIRAATKSSMKDVFQPDIVELKVQSNKMSVTLSMNAVTIIYLNLPSRLRHPVDVHLVTLADEQYIFDREMLLSGLAWDDQPSDPYLNKLVMIWKQYSTRAMFTEITKNKGLPKPSMTPMCVIKFGETLAPYISDRIVNNVTVSTMWKKVSQFTLYMSTVLSEKLLIDNVEVYDRLAGDLASGVPKGAIAVLPTAVKYTGKRVGNELW